MKWIFFALMALLATGDFSPVPAVDEARQAYERMVEEATREADDYLEEKQKQSQQTAEEVQTQQDAALGERIQAERKRIEAEMDTVRNRGLGPNFTQGMKENQLQEWQAQLDRLMSDPQAYFGGQ